ncbi:hypothetical protein BD779DRAFT_473938 [Infundibulicybe gibba]|nr:hypothetical protein BD779DRAFT_473938 [Infundibulicybe gibba]
MDCYSTNRESCVHPLEWRHSPSALPMFCLQSAFSIPHFLIKMAKLSPKNISALEPSVENHSKPQLDATPATLFPYTLSGGNATTRLPSDPRPRRATMAAPATPTTHRLPIRLIYTRVPRGTSAGPRGGAQSFKMQIKEVPAKSDPPTTTLLHPSPLLAETTRPLQLRNCLPLRLRV